MIARQRACADSTSLNTIARAAVGLPAPRVTFVRSLTVENADSIGFDSGEDGAGIPSDSGRGGVGTRGEVPDEGVACRGCVSGICVVRVSAPSIGRHAARSTRSSSISQLASQPREDQADGFVDLFVSTFVDSSGRS